MRRSFLSRLSGLFLATLVSLSAPGVSLAHGYAHHEAKEHAEHEHEHHHGSSKATPAAAEDLTAAAVEAMGGSGDHGHPELPVATSGRVDGTLFVVAPKVELPACTVVESQASLLLTAAPPRAGPSDAPPRQPRAPPLG